MTGSGSADQPPPRAAIRSTEEGTLDRQLRQSLLAGGPRALGEDAQWECADLCLASGRPALARALYELVFLRRGFSAADLRWQAEVASRTGLWTPDGAPDETAVPRPLSTVALARDELRQLAQRLTSPDADHQPDDGPNTADAVPPASDRESVADVVHQLYGLMRRPSTATTQPLLGRTLARLTAESGRPPETDLALISTVPLPHLATAVIRNGLARWLADCRDLTDEPFGSGILLHAAARFDMAGLGPYFGNVGRIIRTSADILSLARRASAAGSPGIDLWVALLSRTLTGSTLQDLVDELGHRGALSTLEVLWRRTAIRRHSDSPMDLLWRLRDTAIDLEAFDLAADVQADIVRLRPRHAHELTILGSIQATGGQVVEAEAVFKRCLAINPNDDDARARLRALKAGRFEPFEIREGFGTAPLHRRARRIALAGRQATPETPRPDGVPVTGPGVAAPRDPNRR